MKALKMFARAARYILPWVGGFTAALTITAVIDGLSVWPMLLFTAIMLNGAAVVAVLTPRAA